MMRSGSPDPDVQKVFYAFREWGRPRDGGRGVVAVVRTSFVEGPIPSVRRDDLGYSETTYALPRSSGEMNVCTLHDERGRFYSSTSPTLSLVMPEALRLPPFPTHRIGNHPFPKGDEPFPDHLVSIRSEEAIVRREAERQLAALVRCGADVMTTDDRPTMGLGFERRDDSRMRAFGAIGGRLSIGEGRLVSPYRRATASGAVPLAFLDRDGVASPPAGVEIRGTIGDPLPSPAEEADLASWATRSVAEGVTAALRASIAGVGSRCDATLDALAAVLEDQDAWQDPDGSPPDATAAAGRLMTLIEASRRDGLAGGPEAPVRVLADVFVPWWEERGWRLASRRRTSSVPDADMDILGSFAP